MDVPHRAMASPVGRRLSSFASARASSSSARRTRSADPGFPFWLAPSRRLFVARDDEAMFSPRRSSPSRHDSAEQSHWFRDLLRVRSRTVGARTQRCRFFLLPLLLLRQGSTQTAPFAYLSSGVRDSWTARFSRYLAALPPLGAWNSTSQLWVYQLVANFVGHSTE